MYLKPGFESDGATGRVECQGFLATKNSKITRYVLEILDGGETALRLRMQKYGHGDFSNKGT